MVAKDSAQVDFKNDGLIQAVCIVVETCSGTRDGYSDEDIQARVNYIADKVNNWTDTPGWTRRNLFARYDASVLQMAKSALQIAHASGYTVPELNDTHVIKRGHTPIQRMLGKRVFQSPRNRWAPVFNRGGDTHFVKEYPVLKMLIAFNWETLQIELPPYFRELNAAKLEAIVMRLDMALEEISRFFADTPETATPERWDEKVKAIVELRERWNR